MGLSVSDISCMGPAAQKQILDKLREKNNPSVRCADTSLYTREALGAESAKGAAKYHNVKAVRVMPNGEERVFDSQKEARRYDELLTLLRAGQIRELKLQPQYTLQESYITAEGNRVRAIRYVADFAYKMPKDGAPGETQRSGFVGERTSKEAGGCRCIAAAEQSRLWEDVVEDVKSKATETRVYKVKKKLMQERFGISIREV